MKQRRVAVLGGGVAGMTAAHELAERGFDVVLYEARDVPGGKARSIPVPGTGTGGRADLPGEHGFRFFPAFYKHLPDTLRRIPYRGQPNGVLDNLVPVRHVHALGNGVGEVMRLPAHVPGSLEEVGQWAGFLLRNDFGLPLRDRLYFARRILMLLTSCEERRLREYEYIDWWRFIGAEEGSPQYQRSLVDCSRMLVAARARESSTRTFGYVFLQLVLGMLQPGAHADRVLNGPTSEMWIQPWWEELRRLGVDCRAGARVTALHVADGRVTGAELESGGQRSVAEADHYVAALPLEAVRPLMTEALKEADPRLAKLDRLETAWMNGVQLYFDRDVSFVDGHTVYLDSPWSLISIAQAQHWPGVPLSFRGDGTVRDILSVVISEWDKPGLRHRKPASRCTRQELVEEVLAQVRDHLDGATRARLDSARLVTWFVDPALVSVAPDRLESTEPLLINTPGSWDARPDAVTGIPNLFLASDYVRTNTDLPSMEAANEAARRAVNGVLDTAGDTSSRCELWSHGLPHAFAPLQKLDRIRFSLGRPHVLDGPRILPGPVRRT